MHTITYVSTANTDLEEDEINQLLESSKYSNNRNGITGIFMYAEGNFFQILEGDEKLVKALFNRIKNDQRHYDIIKLLDKHTEDNSFKDYNSSFAVVNSKKNLKELHKYLKRAKKYNPQGFQSISYITKKFITLI